MVVFFFVSFTLCFAVKSPSSFLLIRLKTKTMNSSSTGVNGVLSGLQRAHRVALRCSTSLRVCGVWSEETRMPCSAAPGSSAGAPIPVNKQKSRAEGGERMRKPSCCISGMLAVLR